MNRNLAIEHNWIPAVMLVNDIMRKYGGAFWDTESGKALDAGQLVCRAAYGADWMQSLEFKKCDDAEAPPKEFMEAARSILDRLPDWARVQP
jgi:hypothetical protein